MRDDPPEEVMGVCSNPCMRGSMGVESLAAIENAPHNETRNGLPLFQRNWYGRLEGRYQRFVIWATDERLSHLRHEGHVFIDATFKVVPHPFCQLLVMMTFDPATRVFVPCVYALMTARTEYAYLTVLHEIVVLLNFRFMPRLITVDFEKALVIAVKHEFPSSRLVGCHFHFMQAIDRKLRKFAISEEDKEVALSVIRWLPGMPRGSIEQVLCFLTDFKGLRVAEWKRFWDYFRRTWTVTYPYEIWSLTDLDV